MTGYIKNGKYLFFPDLTDTALCGKDGKAYLIARDGEERVGMTETVPVSVTARGNGNETEEEPPEAGSGWVANVLAAAEQAENYAEQAKESADRAEEISGNLPKLSENNTWLIWNTETEQYEDTGVVAVGKDAEVDETLSIPGAAADAKATGDRLSTLNSTVNKSVNLVLSQLGNKQDKGDYALRSEIPEVDTTLSVEGKAADAKAAGDTIRTIEKTCYDSIAVFSGRINTHYQNLSAADKALEAKIPDIPKVSEPHQYLITDENGDKVWVEQLGYVTQEEKVLFAETEITSDRTIPGLSQLVDIQEGDLVKITFNGEVYETNVTINGPFYVVSIPNMFQFMLRGVGQSMATSNMTGQGGTFSAVVVTNNYHTIDPNLLPISAKGGEGNNSIILNPSPSTVANGANSLSANVGKSYGNNAFAANQGSASGESSAAFGASTTATGAGSFSQGLATTAKGTYQHVEGKLNAADGESKYAHIVGNGYYDNATQSDIRSNAYALDWDGNANFAGDVYVGGDGQNDFAGAKRVVTEEEVPASEEPHMFLATDAEGNRIWAKQLGYVTRKEQQLFAETEIPTGQSTSLIMLTYVKDGDPVKMTFNGEIYEGTIISATGGRFQIYSDKFRVIMAEPGVSVTMVNLTGIAGTFSATVVADKYYTIDPHFLPIQSARGTEANSLILTPNMIAKANGTNGISANLGIASGASSFAANRSTVSGSYSFGVGSNTIASGKYQMAEGRYNVEDTEEKYAHIIGNGTANDARSNAHTLGWDGTAWFAGDVYVGGTGQDDTENAKKLATEDKIPTDDHINSLIATKTAEPTLEDIETFTLNMDKTGMFSRNATSDGRAYSFDAIYAKIKFTFGDTVPTTLLSVTLNGMPVLTYHGQVSGCENKSMYASALSYKAGGIRTVGAPSILSSTEISSMGLSFFINDTLTLAETINSIGFAMAGATNVTAEVTLKGIWHKA